MGTIENKNSLIQRNKDLGRHCGKLVQFVYKAYGYTIRDEGVIIAAYDEFAEVHLPGRMRVVRVKWGDILGKVVPTTKVVGLDK